MENAENAENAKGGVNRKQGAKTKGGVSRKQGMKTKGGVKTKGGEDTEGGQKTKGGSQDNVVGRRADSNSGLTMTKRRSEDGTTYPRQRPTPFLLPQGSR